MTAPRTLIVVPRRADGGRRDDLWRFCRQWWEQHLPEIRLIEGHHEAGRFNRAAAVNDAVRRVGLDTLDVVLVLDSDVIAEPAQVLAAIERAHETGRLTFAYDTYRGLDRGMTDRVLAGFDGSWLPGVRTKVPGHVSSVLAIPAALFERMGGFDQRVSGWGPEDTIAAHCARVLGGGLERIPGDVWHLWHEPSPDRDPNSPDLLAAQALARRYFSHVEPSEVEALVAEKAEPDGVLMIVLTHGRRDCIARTIPSAREQLKGLPVTRVVISDDSGDVEYQAWLRLRFPDCDLVWSHRNGGFASNMRQAWATAVASGQRWIFWLEDDYLFPQPIDLSAMAYVLGQHPDVAQMMLRRQPWFPAEIEAGGIIERHPEAYEDCTDGGHAWLRHRLGYWTNPHLVSRSFLAAHTWPAGADSEARFGRSVMRRWSSGVWGARHEAPTIEHFGERDGIGY